MKTKATGRVRVGARAVPLSERVKKSRAALVKRGGSKIPGGWLQPEPTAALQMLHRGGYSETRVGCIARALVEAVERQDRREKRRRRKDK